jgi:hypothetical protein
MPKSSPFVVVSDREAERARAIVRQPRLSDKKRALLAGEVIWYPSLTPTKAAERAYAIAKAAGKRCEVRDTTREGEQGCYVWLEDR